MIEGVQRRATKLMVGSKLSYSDRLCHFPPTSFPGSFILGKKDPGSGWSRASQKVGGDKKNARGRRKQVAILSFLNSLLKGQICLKM